MAAASGVRVAWPGLVACRPTFTVQRIWRAFGLQPHRSETFKLSSDPDFVGKVRDTLGS